MKVEFHPEALAEFRDAAEYYEKQQNGLGDRFANAIESAIARIVELPTGWRVIEDDIRRYLTKVFPYAVLYSIEDGYILIVAIMHCHREPGLVNEAVVNSAASRPSKPGSPTGTLLQPDADARVWQMRAAVIEIDLACPNDPDDVKILSEVAGEKINEVFIDFA